jgi:hypothetical protein
LDAVEQGLKGEKREEWEELVTKGCQLCLVVRADQRPDPWDRSRRRAKEIHSVHQVERARKVHPAEQANGLAELDLALQVLANPEGVDLHKNRTSAPDLQNQPQLLLLNRVKTADRD